MKEQFVNEFLTRLYDQIPDEYLNVIQKELILHTKDYDINKKETSVSIYEGHIPNFYKIYMVSRKISGLSQKTLDLYNMYQSNPEKVINTILKGKFDKIQQIILTATPIAKTISNNKNKNFFINIII